MKKRVYTTFPHTADLGIEVYGADLPALFEHSASALFDLMINPRQIKEKEAVEFSVRADEPELLLREWLGELLYYSISRHFIFKSFRIKKLTGRELQATATGEAFDSQRYNLKREIKSVTYHELKIIHGDNGWQARFVLDI
ncbi:MAG: archease [Candidatus Marinimicrobia bacterium]|nr:archease [Candidatus Neomarinimicrobiota bacterium]